MKISPEFPDYRHQDPMRQAELVTYKQVAASDAPGVALYECHPTPSSPEVDFVIILEGVAHFAVQVKGGHWRMEDGQFQLLTDQGWITKTAPPTQACDAAYAVRNAVRAVLGRSIYIIPVILFPDMEPDADILNWRANHALPCFSARRPSSTGSWTAPRRRGRGDFPPAHGRGHRRGAEGAEGADARRGSGSGGTGPGIPQFHIHVHLS